MRVRQSERTERASIPPPTPCTSALSGLEILFAEIECSLILKKAPFLPLEFRNAATFAHISRGCVAGDHRDRVGGAARLERRLSTLELHPLCLLAKRPLHRRARCVASASVSRKPAHRGRTSHHRQSALDQTG